MRPLENIRLVAMREIQVRIRSKAFRYSTLFIIGLIVIGASGAQFAEDFFQRFEPSYTLAVVDENSEEMRGSLLDTAESLDVELEVTAYESEAEAAESLADGDSDAILLEREELRFEDSPQNELSAIANQAVSALELPAALEDAGLSPEEFQDLISGTALEIDSVSTASDAEDASFAVASATAVLLFISIMTYGQWVLQGVVEEKSSRVVEILLSTIRPFELLTGKVLGILALAVMQLGALLVTLGVVVAANPDISLPAVAAQGLAAAALWFLLGLVLYGFVYGCAGALISRQEDAGNVTMPFVAVLSGAYFLTIIGVVNAPESLLSRVLSLVPFTAPLAMPARAAFGAAGVLDFVLAVVLMLMTIAFVIALGGRIYAGAVLRTGARVALRDAWRLGR